MELALLDSPDILYVFKPTNASNFAGVSEGSFEIHMVICEMLKDIEMDQLIQGYNKHQKHNWRSTAHNKDW